MRRVLFVATVVKTHIMEFHIPYLKRFKDLGWETMVAAKNDYEEKSNCSIPFCDCFYDIPFGRNPLAKDNIKAYLALRTIIRQGEFDIIHCHTPVGAALTRVASIGTRKKGTVVIYTAHGFHFYSGAPIINWLLYYPIEKILSHCTDVIITINSEDYNRAKRFKSSKVEYIPGVGIETESFIVSTSDVNREGRNQRKEFGIPDNARVLLSVGEVNKNKNHKEVIRAMSKMNDEYYYIICGRGPLIDKNERLAKELNLSDRVLFTGYRTDVNRFYSMADVFVFPSLREGLPVSVMEAMASGLPVVCTNIRGSRDLITDGENGFCYNQGDISSLKTSIDRAYELKSVIKDKNILKASLYSIDTIRDQYFEIYNREIGLSRRQNNE